MAMLDDVRNALWTESQQLWTISNNSALPAAVQNAASLELVEVNHRLAITQGQSLSLAATALQAQAQLVAGAQTQAQQALNAAQTAANVTTAVTDFLSVVDNFIDAAKSFFV